MLCKHVILRFVTPSGLKTGMAFRGQFWKRVWKMTLFRLKYGQDFAEPSGTPPPPPQGWMSSRIDHFDRAANKFGQQQTLNGQFFFWVAITIQTCTLFTLTDNLFFLKTVMISETLFHQQGANIKFSEFQCESKCRWYLSWKMWLVLLERDLHNWTSNYYLDLAFFCFLRTGERVPEATLPLL